MRLERFLHNSGKKVPMQRGQPSNFPWREMFGMVAAGAKAVETALEGSPKNIVDATIDATPKK